ncbi:DUF6765 family protein [Acaryochloris sp. IP29b_bin.137]|uniref:DUF6765 family protein n=1 Tax=Acaryochloris sp. IP29b_bin.137 TaxID=2969217 RepID=UPI0026193BB6|nr:DUF6765 family protein [Acaryochloris sp. IP29b_bin.137]
MQIDFHNGVTYIVARLAGFEHPEADVIAHCAQYVDDATNSGLIHFDNGTVFNHISSAHKLLDYRNFRLLANCQVWIPFHFLPGNEGLPTQQNTHGTFINKLICRPNSHVAQDMLRECIQLRNTHHGLYRLGIAMHVYADTWAHQGFAGVNHQVNEATKLVDSQGHPDLKFTKKVKAYFKKNLVENFAGHLLSEVFPLGHGAVLGHPDKPFLKWGYTNGFNEKISRDNPKDYLEAADQMCQWLRRYCLGDPDAPVAGLPAEDKAQIAQHLQSFNHKDDEVRHHQWLDLIRNGRFSFGSAHLSYIHKGIGSWKHNAIGTEALLDTGEEVFQYHPKFLESHWKLFHEALIAHRSFIVDTLLPKYDIHVGANKPVKLTR